MKKKLILIVSSIILVFGLAGCKNEKETINDTISNNYADIDGEDLEVVEWSYSAKEPNNKDKNNANFMGDITMGCKDYMSKKAVNINLREGQSLKIETEINYPITVMLKDNSNEEYLFNKTSFPVDNAILVDAVKKDGEYELMVDFNEVDEFTFKVYIVNKKH